MKITNTILIIASLISIAIFGSVWYVFNKIFSDQKQTVPSLPNISLSSTSTQQLNSTIAPYLTETYTNNRFSFAFNYPKEYTIEQTPETGAQSTTILVHDAQGNGFQIYIAYQSSLDPIITAQQIKHDIPRMVVLDPQEFQVAGANKGVTFISENVLDHSKQREVWFIQKGYLYQITATLGAQKVLEDILNSLRFK